MGADELCELLIMKLKRLHDTKAHWESEKYHGVDLASNASSFGDLCERIANSLRAQRYGIHHLSVSTAGDLTVLVTYMMSELGEYFLQKSGRVSKRIIGGENLLKAIPGVHAVSVGEPLYRHKLSTMFSELSATSRDYTVLADFVSRSVIDISGVVDATRDDVFKRLERQEDVLLHEEDEGGESDEDLYYIADGGEEAEFLLK